ncbi:MAG: hypothetical protein HOO96_29995 [Polyangiaceae bacterium]|nr:hypothetical protein [Polyangiaceae bacterium]
MSWRAAFDAVASRLRAHPRVEVLGYFVFDPVSDEEVDAVHEALGYALAPSLLSLFREANGLQLRWVLRDDPVVLSQPDRFAPMSAPSRSFFEDHQSGAIYIASLTETFLTDWEGVLWFEDWMTDDEREPFVGREWGLRSSRQRLRPVDGFAAEADMAFFLDGSADPPLLLGDEDRRYRRSRITDFASYLAFLVAHHGLTAARQRVYEHADGHALPRLTTPAAYWGQHGPRSLDVLLEDT